MFLMFGDAWGIMDIMLLVFFIVVVLGAGLYFLNKWATKKVSGQQEMVAQMRTVTSIYVIDKKKDKAQNVNLPKAASAQMPKMYKFIKMPFVKAKIGPQIVTLMCDNKVYNALPIKKNVKVGLAGMYIADMVGMKTEREMKELKKQKRKETGEKPDVLGSLMARFKK